MIIILIIILILFILNNNKENFDNINYTKYNFNSFYEFLQGNNNFNPYDNNTEFDNYNIINFNTNNNYNDALRESTIIFDNRIKNVFTNELSSKNISSSKSTDLYKNIDPINHKKCCLVSKVLNRDENNIGQFKYNFIKMENDKCNLDLYNLDNNNQLLFDGENNWSNDNCINDNINQNIGSCRRNNFECVDFIDKNICENMINKNTKLATVTNNYNLEWSLLTCYDPLYKKVIINNN